MRPRLLTAPDLLFGGTLTPLVSLIVALSIPVAAYAACSQTITSYAQITLGQNTTLNYSMYGGGGGGHDYDGANGQYVTGSFNATAGHVLTVYAGGGGGAAMDSGGGGGGSGWFGGGGGAGAGGGGGGGGSSAILDNGAVVNFAAGGNGGDGYMHNP